MIQRVVIASLALAASVSGFVGPAQHGRNSAFVLKSTETVEPQVDYEVPEDAVIQIKPAAMVRLRELREKQAVPTLVLRMGVRNGGCSGLSYVMDFASEDDIEDDDAIDEYTQESIKCVVDAKSMLYLYGLELDYSDELIGGGFKVRFKPGLPTYCTARANTAASL
jgi:iron-sulfur cluster assembly accessory protein